MRHKPLFVIIFAILTNATCIIEKTPFDLQKHFEFGVGNEYQIYSAILNSFTPQPLYWLIQPFLGISQILPSTLIVYFSEYSAPLAASGSLYFLERNKESANDMDLLRDNSALLLPI